MSKDFNNVKHLGDEVEVKLKNGKATIQPLSLVNDSYGFVTFKMSYDGTKYESTKEVPFIDLPEGQIQVSWVGDILDTLEVFVFEAD